MLFDNITIRLLGSDDFPTDAKTQAAEDLTAAAAAGAFDIPIADPFPLEQIAAAQAESTPVPANASSSPSDHALNAVVDGRPDSGSSRGVGRCRGALSPGWTGEPRWSPRGTDRTEPAPLADPVLP